MHYAFRSKLVHDVLGQKELFSVGLNELTDYLQKNLDPSEIIGKPKVDRMFMDKAFRDYLTLLFRYTGLNRWLDFQGAWTLVLFPQTMGGRYFTINISGHETAFSSLPRKDREQVNMLYVDKLILDFPETLQWLEKHDGEIIEDNYKSALEHGACVMFCGGFDLMPEFLCLPGVRRSIIAYWTEFLLLMRDKGTESVYKRYHNYNAVTAIINLLREERRVQLIPTTRKAK
jgi:hypothetical protein